MGSPWLIAFTLYIKDFWRYLTTYSETSKDGTSNLTHLITLIGLFFFEFLSRVYIGKNIPSSFTSLCSISIDSRVWALFEKVMATKVRVFSVNFLNDNVSQ